MSGRDLGPDEARPIPQSSGTPWEDEGGSADDAFEVDTRRGGRGAGDDDGYVVDTRRKPRPIPSGTSRRPRNPRRLPAGTRQVAPGMLYEEDRDYVSPPERQQRAAMPTATARPSARPAPSGSGDGHGDDPYAAPSGRGPQPPRPSSAKKRRKRIRRTVGGVVALLVVAWVAFMVWVPFDAWNHVTKVDNAPAGERPADTAGHNYLLVGSDGREGLTDAQKQELNASGADNIGKRTDSIILVHVPEHGGKSSLISIPRDSYVPIPGHGSNKINAAFAFGGAKLLEATVEGVTGIHVDGYVEIGFGGFASVVDSLGGVNVCVPFDMDDKDAAINLKKGCQTLDGATALGYVRARKSDPRGDIGRAERQRQFLGAIMKKAVTPSTVLIPTRYKGFADASAGGLEVGQDTTLRDAVRVLQTLRGVDGGDTLSLVVPISDPNYQTPAGSSVKWDTERALALFTMIKNDEPMTVPPEGTTGT